jgi:hypothetical protein
MSDKKPWDMDPESLKELEKEVKQEVKKDEATKFVCDLIDNVVVHAAAQQLVEMLDTIASSFADSKDKRNQMLINLIRSSRDELMQSTPEGIKVAKILNIWINHAVKTGRAK